MEKTKKLVATIVVSLTLASIPTLAKANTLYANPTPPINQQTLSAEKLWIFKNNSWFYSTVNGDCAKGLQTIGNSQYFFDLNTGVMKTGWILHNNVWYYGDTSGALMIGWHNINNSWYYFDKETCIMKTGFLKFSDKVYNLGDNGAMKTGWVLCNNAWYHMDNNGAMMFGWLKLNNNWYYLDRETGIMKTGLLTLNDKLYNLNDDGKMLTGWYNLNNKWHYFDNKDGYAVTDRLVGIHYINSDGSYTTVTPDMSHSNLQYNLFKYISDYNNQNNTLDAAIRLHNGELENNCVYFQSEALRRIGVNIPTNISYTTHLESQLTRRGWKKCYDLNQLKPGDIVFSGTSHVFTFMHWDKGNYAYIVDNQRKKFGSVLHKRNIFSNDQTYDTFKATHFYTYTN